MENACFDTHHPARLALRALVVKAGEVRHPMNNESRQLLAEGHSPQARLSARNGESKNELCLGARRLRPHKASGPAKRKYVCWSVHAAPAPIERAHPCRTHETDADPPDAEAPREHPARYPSRPDKPRSRHRRTRTIYDVNEKTHQLAASLARTSSATFAPSARPVTTGLSAAITFPRSFTDAAPVAAIASATARPSSPSVRGSGR